MTRAIWVTSKSPVEGLRFHPGAVRGWMGVSPKELVDQMADSQEFPLLCHARSLGHIITLTRRNVISAVDLRVQHAIAALTKSPSLRISQVALQLEMSSRHLHRLFLLEVGLSPKHFARIQRLGRLKHALKQPKGLAELANSVGYSDQAHMTREVRNLTGTTPAQLWRMSDSFKTS